MHPSEAAWKKITGHIGGTTLGSTLHGLHIAQDKVLPGYLAVARRVLKELNQEPTTPHRNTASSLETALEIQHSFQEGGTLPELTAFLEPDETYLRTVEGPVATSVMTELSLSGFFERCEPSSRLNPCLDFLTGLGWWNADHETLTEAGKFAAMLAPQYYHTAGYLRLFNFLPRVMTGDPDLLVEMESDEHLRRDIDIASSTRVFEATCREPLREIVLPLFSKPFAEQPKALVDTGCGEGTLLAGLYADIKAHTKRGAHLADYPLTLVGIDPSPVARTVCHNTLATLDSPFHVLDGDIGSPEDITEHLQALGFAPMDVLHMSKSVFHNRRLRTSIRQEIGTRGGTTQNAFVWKNGEVAPAEVVEEDLIQLTRRWKPSARRHGLLIIEAHTLNASDIKRDDMRPILALNDATHGYSGQFLLEAHVFHSLLKKAGLVAEQIHEVGTIVFGSPIMTLGLYKPS